MEKKIKKEKRQKIDYIEKTKKSKWDGELDSDSNQSFDTVICSSDEAESAVQVNIQNDIPWPLVRTKRLTPEHPVYRMLQR